MRNENGNIEAVERMKPSVVQGARAEAAWREVAPVVGLERQEVFTSFGEAMGFVTRAWKIAESGGAALDFTVHRVTEAELRVRVYVGRPITAGITEADRDLANAIADGR